MRCLGGVRRSGRVRGVVVRFSVVLVAVVLWVLVGASCVFAESPWWHLTSGALPSVLQASAASDEVQEVMVSATSGEFVLIEMERFEAAFFKWNASHEEVQAGLEVIYGAGNVEVSGGPGDEEGTKPYVITFVGGLGDRPVSLMNADFSSFFLGCEGATGSGCKAAAHASEASKGMPTGQILVTAANLGDAEVNGGASPVSVVDKLPPGLEAVSIKGFSGVQRDPIGCDLASLTCTFGGTLPPYGPIEVFIDVVMKAGASSGEANEASVSGGGAPHTSVSRPVRMGGEPARFGVEDYELTNEDEGGALDTQAGSHPFQQTTTIVLIRGSNQIRAVICSRNRSRSRRI